MHGFLTVFADASFCHRSMAAGYAIWARDDDRKVARHAPIPVPMESSGSAELFALSLGILEAIDSLHHEPGFIVVAQSDCEHAIRILTGETTGSPEESGMRDSVRAALAANGLNLRFKHVKGHTGDEDKRSYVNRWCDINARREMRKARALRDIK